MKISSKITSLSINSGNKEPGVHNWQRILIEIPNDKLIVSVKEARASYMPTRIQALVIVRQRINGRSSKCLLLFVEEEFFF